MTNGTVEQPKNGIETLSTDAIDLMLERRDYLKHNNVKTLITGVTDEERKQLELAGLNNQGTKIYTHDQSTDALESIAEEGDNIVALQIGSEPGNLIAPKGGSAQAEVHMKGITEKGNGAVTDTLEGDRLTNALTGGVATGAESVVFDFSRTRAAKPGAQLENTAVNVDQAA